MLSGRSSIDPLHIKNRFHKITHESLDQQIPTLFFLAISFYN
jgi:hypothetical protein